MSTMQARILLAEDDPNLLKVIAYHLKKERHVVSEARDGLAAFDLLTHDSYDLLLTDVRMPKMSGLELLQAVRQRGMEIPVLVMTAYGTIHDAVEAMRLGASDYLAKPVEGEALLLAVNKALRLGILTNENRRLRENLLQKKPLESIIGTSAAINETLGVIRRVAPTDATVLVTGESGTGKELVAQALHSLSPRMGKPFVALNCAAVPKDLLESELFGHERGSFTGATESRPGKFLQAEGGTLFLDEIGDMEIGLQAKILRALQERVVEPVGGKGPQKVDVRIIAATNRNLLSAVKSGHFREDLYWRVNVVPINVPPLRERHGDVRLLFFYFWKMFCGYPPQLSAEAEKGLNDYSWPGNVRELQSLCQRLAILHPGGEITPESFPPEMRPGEQESDEQTGGLRAIERNAIKKALESSSGNQSAAARALRIPRHILIYRMKKYGLS